MRMLDDGLRLFWMVYVILQAFFEIGEIVFYLNIVIIRFECALHEPCLLRQLGCDGNRIGRHHPLQVRGDVVAFQ